MKANIDKDGTLLLYVENETQEYAIKKWMEDISYIGDFDKDIIGSLPVAIVYTDCYEETRVK